MNNLKKVGLTALAGALVSVSASAADLSVTGGASISFAGEEKKRHWKRLVNEQWCNFCCIS